MGKIRKWMNRSRFAMAATLALLLGAGLAEGGDKTSVGTVMAKLLVTVEGKKDAKPPELKREDVAAKVGKERVQVKHWEAAKGQYAGLALFILVDDVLDPSVGGLFDDVKDFIQAQPATTLIGIGYMRNGTVAVAQDLTNDHEKAAKALRLPTGNAGTYASCAFRKSRNV